MKVNYYSFKIKTTILLLFICIFGIHNLKAQDTIFYPDEQYYWEDFIGVSQTSHIHWWTLDMSLHDDFRRPVILKEIIFPSTTETRVYGVAGTTVGCNNPYGCYFYLCKKINGEYVILDSAAWHHTANYRYIHCYYDSIPHSESSEMMSYYKTLIPHGVPIIDSVNGNVPIYEAYFDYPIAVNDTFYIGMNVNCVLEPNHYNLPIWPTNIDSMLYYSFQVLVAYQDVIDQWTNWIDSPFSRNYTQRTSGNYGAFFPILTPPTCPTIMETKVDSLTYCSAHIGWRQTYVSSYCRIEYGEEGFVRGSGTMVDNITTADVTLNNLLPNTGYDVYLQSYCAASDTVSGWRKISFVTLDTMCPALENLRMLYVRDVRAKIRWDNPSPEVSHCELEWGKSGFEQGQGNYVRYVYDTSYSFLSLAAGTTYDVYIRTYCPRSNVYGDWQKLTFTTDGNSINEAENQLPISVNPNPTTGMVDVTLPQGYENQTVEVYDVQGKLLQSQCLQNGKATFNLSEYPNGVYVIKVGNASCRVVKSK
ncbi:MAG: T9SS type A sorting domain-containing protein [Bacteroidales bacterium]|nr:T9SS type A sorting domain-containing protein [Bacteroidales bacterium]